MPLQILPLVGLLHLEAPATVGDAWAISHRVTQERVVLPEPRSGQWLLGYNDEGLGFLDDAEEEGQQGLWVVDRLKMVLYKDDNGVEVLRSRAGQRMLLQDFLTEKSDVNIDWDATGKPNPEHVYRAAVFRRIEGGEDD